MAWFIGWCLAALGVTRLRYEVARPLPRGVVIPARINGRDLPDEEVVELFLRVDLRLLEAQPVSRREWV